MHDTTARLQFQNRKSDDEIRISCACKVCERRASALKFFVSTHFFCTRLHVDRACVQSKIILHKLARVTVCWAGIDQKRANQRQVIRRKCRHAALSFSSARTALRFKLKTLLA
jgi:hypothetical protein